MTRLLALALCLFLPALAQAACTGRNLIDALPEATRAELRARTDAAPFARGNLWRATKAGAEVTLAGTYHLDDPRHDTLMARLQPEIDRAAILLVEAGPEEEAKLQAALARDPSVILVEPGTSLDQTLPPEEWAALAEALKARGIPAFIGARFRPAYLSVLLAVPPCIKLTEGRPDGLDARLQAAARARGLPVRALEPFDVALSLFTGLDDTVQQDQLRAAIALAETGDDQIVTLADAYFAGDSRIIWEFTRHVTATLPGMTLEKLQADLDQTEALFINARNRAWIPVIEAAATEGPVLAAFGALHLSGEAGVLNLMQKAGWSVTPLDAP